MTTEARIIIRSTADGTISQSYEFSAINLCEASIRAALLNFSEVLVWIDGKTVRTISVTERAALALKDRATAYEVRDEINAFLSKLVNGKEYLESRWNGMTAAQREEAKAMWIIPGIRGGSIFATLGRLSGNWWLLSTKQLANIVEGNELPSLGMRPWALPSTREARAA
ncbi:hypothetical protein GUK30_32675 [Rhizobium leguminosarum]|uniref:hypothetical protein n=1 Tax=Rhizobium TaxID=379 RepID=UPI0013BFE2ED|nr:MULTISPECIES: hypothetical protein [Rhizobium]MBY3575443.1 hypothetical protein [Rhizobium laguerreae]NEI24103.1 hypothetical protein [Rhizobium ruizarguesonis]